MLSLLLGFAGRRLFQDDLVEIFTFPPLVSPFDGGKPKSSIPNSPPQKPLSSCPLG